MTTTKRTCVHGAVVGGEPWPEGFAWAGPVGDCRCCKAKFTYMGSGTYEEHRVVETDYRPKDLCETCGGMYSSFDSAELDAEVAEKVMGLAVIKKRERIGERSADGQSWEPMFRDVWELRDADVIGSKAVPLYSLTETMEVVKKMLGLGFVIRINPTRDRSNDEVHGVVFEKGGKELSNMGHPDIGRAICWSAVEAIARENQERAKAQ